MPAGYPHALPADQGRSLAGQTSGAGMGKAGAPALTDGRDVMRGYGIRVGAFFAALCLIYGVHLPYLPLWLEWRGLSADEIALVTSAPLFLRLLATPTLAYVADRRAAHSTMILQLAWTGLIAALVLSQMTGFLAILIVALLLAIATSTIMPLAETVAISGVRRGLDYGRMRLWGSLSFIAASFVGGAVVDWAGRAAGIWLVVAGCVATVTAAYALPLSSGESARRQRPAARVADDTLDLPMPEVTPSRGIDRATVLRLASNPLFLLFLLAIGMVQAAHSTFYTFGAIHWRSGGLSSAWIGTLWAIGVLAEVLLFAMSGRVVAWLGPLQLILAGAVAAVVRWVVMSMDPTLVWLVPLQVLHGLTYGASHLGAIHFISRAVPEEAGGTAQALYSALAAGVLQGMATLLSGALYARYGGLTYLAMALLASIGLVAVLVLQRGWNGRRLWEA